MNDVINNTQQRSSLYFTHPFQVDMRYETCPYPQPDELLIKTVVSAISAGTEMLFYRGQVPAEMQVDATLAEMAEPVRYPLKYGYATVGTVVQVGTALDRGWRNKLVFAFHPHESHFLATPAQLIPIPEGIPAEVAVLLPNMETAVNFVMDGAPVIGERVVVLGQGIVGLLTASVLAQFPLAKLHIVDRYPLRRACAQALGVRHAYAQLTRAEQQAIDADLVFELTGNPAALNDAIAMTGFGGRVLIGSWYGQKQSQIDLGGHFHRNRIRLVSSQVSTIAPSYLGRWDKTRRFEVAWQMLQKLDADQLITQRIPIHDAGQAYDLLDQKPEEAIQILLTYE